MRVSGITAYTRTAVQPQKQMQQKQNVSFGRFADDNADKVIKKVFEDDVNDIPEGHFHKLIKKEQGVIVYTAPDRSIRYKVDKDYLAKNSEALKKAKFLYDKLAKKEGRKDLSKKDNARDLATMIKYIKKELSGTTGKGGGSTNGRSGLNDVYDSVEAPDAPWRL